VFQIDRRPLLLAQIDRRPLLLAQIDRRPLLLALAMQLRRQAR